MSIESLFRNSMGQPVLLDGRVIQLVDQLKIGSMSSLEIKIVCTNSKWRQGVYLTTRGAITVAGTKMARGTVLWADTAPPVVLAHVDSSDGIVAIRNVWDIGDGVMHSWHGGGAMSVTSQGNQRTYHCNDGEDDEDFDDLVFTVTICNTRTLSID